MIFLVGVHVATANEVAYGAVNTDLYDGIKGNAGIRTDPTSVAGIAYIHTAQVSMPNSDDFVGIGTYKGSGTGPGHSHDCGNHYDPGANWSGFYDFELNLVYGCYEFGANQWLSGDNPTFEIQYTYCPTIGNRWVMKFAGTQRGCMSMGNTQGDSILAGLEAYGTIDRNIDVRYTNLKKNHPGSTTWSDIGDTRAARHVDPNYVYAYISNTAFDVYLPPLD